MVEVPYFFLNNYIDNTTWQTRDSARRTVFMSIFFRFHGWYCKTLGSEINAATKNQTKKYHKPRASGKFKKIQVTVEHLQQPSATIIYG